MYKEIDKQARLQAEYNQVKTAVNEATKLVDEYKVRFSLKAISKSAFTSRGG